MTDKNEQNFGAAGAAGSHIDIGSDADLHAWAKKLDATPDQLKEAVGAVGNLAADVEMHLKGSRSTTNSEQTAQGGN